MDTKLYHLSCRLKLKPVWHNDPPAIIVTFNNNIVYAGRLYQPIILTIDEYLPNNQYQLSIEFVNKQNIDTDIINNLDKAVIIDNIVFNNITSNQFIWAGMYEPIYPEPWATEQRSQGIMLNSQVKAHNYLSWNGKWTLTFDVPVFTWIHKTENLGWIYS